MGKVAIVVMLITLAVAKPIVHSKIEEPKEVDEWFHKVRLGLAAEKVTKLHFYFHDIQSGKNPTAMRVAQSSFTDKSPTLFGLVNMVDDPLTEGPELTSKEVGRAQGLYGLAGLEELSLLMTLNYVFTSGEYNGSTLSILGRNPVWHPVREMPIVGGSGVFRLARGVATAKTYSFNVTTGNAVVEYNVLVIHY
ncbi:hypothetical protein L1049_015367 [Liquidambar formosana]|uniref:Dirigent protein n=1 Tax=Liquidambar formosana TaxID=63359 RepID=A0AAP0WZP8_LIQFO